MVVYVVEFDFRASPLILDSKREMEIINNWKTFAFDIFITINIEFIMFKFRFMLLIAAFIFTGCSDLVAPDSENEVIGPQTEQAISENALFAAKGGNKAEIAGQVSRFEEGVFRRLYDEKSNIHVVLGGNIVDFCNGEGSASGVVDVQHVDHPTQENRYHRTWRGELFATVWEGPLRFPASCDDYGVMTPVVATTVNARFHDNDFVAGQHDGKNTDSYGWSFNGPGLSGHQQCTWDGEDVSTNKCNTNIQVKNK